MKKIFSTLTILSLLLLSANFVKAQSAEEFFMLGNNAYKSGDYKKAVECYESAIDKKFEGAEIRYNLANALAKIDKKGEALLNYKRALYHSPRMREAVANLQIFAKDNAFDDGSEHFATPLIAELSDSEWTSTAFVTFWSTVLMIFIPPLLGRRNTPTIFIAIMFASIFALSIFSISNWRDYTNTAVAIKADVPLRISPTQNAPIESIVTEGQTAKIERKHGNFIYVQTQNGKCGWTQKSDFTPIIE